MKFRGESNALILTITRVHPRSPAVTIGQKIIIGQMCVLFISFKLWAKFEIFSPKNQFQPSHPTYEPK